MFKYFLTVIPEDSFEHLKYLAFILQVEGESMDKILKLNFFASFI